MSYLASLQKLNHAAVSEGREVFTPHGDSSLGLEDRYEPTFLRITLCHSLGCAPLSLTQPSVSHRMWAACQVRTTEQKTGTWRTSHLLCVCRGRRVPTRAELQNKVFTADKTYAAHRHVILRLESRY